MIHSPKKVQTLSQKQIRKPKGQTSLPAPQPTPIHKLNTTSMVWHISTGQRGCLAVLRPSSCTPAHQLQYKKLEKVLDFIATTENSVINILLLLNSKHSGY